MKRKMLLLTLAIPVLLSQNAQAQTSSRLIAQAHWSSNGATLNANDSTAYSYSNGRGGDLNHLLKYDQSTNWIVDTGVYNNNYYYLQSFDANNNLLSTITQYWNGTAWVNWTNVLYTYNSNNTKATAIYQSWGGASWVNNSQDVYSYNTTNQLFSDQNNVWNGLSMTFTPNTLKIYTYDASSNLISEVDQQYSTGSGWTYTNEALYTYSGTELLTSTYNSWSGSAWVSNYMYTNSYDTSGDLLTNLYQTYSGTAWVNQSLKVFSNFTATGSNLAQTETDQTWDTTGSGSWSNVNQYTYSYNSYGQMTSSIGESWNVGVGWEFASGDPAAFYYYQTYSTINTGVKTVVNNAGNVNIYPVPAQNILNIDLTWAQAQTATIAIYDMNGRQINTLNVPMGTQYHGAVSVNNLADGMYVVRIDGTQGQIVKQIVVAH